MKLRGLQKARRWMLLGFLFLCVANVLLAASLLIRVTKPRDLIIVPGMKQTAFVRAGEVPDDAIQSFALLYVARLENYTPETVAQISGQLKAWVAPSYWARASEALSHREKVSHDGKLSCQVLLPLPEEVVIDRAGGLRASLRAYRRRFVGERESESGWVRYQVGLRVALPRPGNPQGLEVTEQRMEEEHEEK